MHSVDEWVDEWTFILVARPDLLKCGRLAGYRFADCVIALDNHAVASALGKPSALKYAHRRLAVCL